MEVNLAEYTQVVQSHVIMNILCGHGQSTKELMYTGVGMKTEKMSLAAFVDKLVWDLFERLEANPLIFMIPYFF